MRVCLIVDHPMRDLDGLALLAAELGLRGVEVFLVPMYQRYETLVLRPDIVLVNYLRHVNVEFLRTCRAVGIRVGVLDTEGGVHQDTSAFAQAMAPYLDAVDLYCVWGRKQFAAMAPHSSEAGFVLRGTGCPRYDFTSPARSGAVPDPAADLSGFVLVNANFPVINPRFQSPERERRQLVIGMGQDGEVVAERLRQTTQAQRALVETVSRLARQFSKVTFVMRPHPFEAIEPYQRWFEAEPNVQVRQEGSVLEWLSKASLLLHHNCSTAIEAFLMGREPVHLGFIGGELLRQPASVAVSHSAGSFEEVVGIVQQVANGGPFLPSSELVQRRRQVVEDFFWADDGRAAERVADAVVEAIAKQDPLIREPGRRYALRLLRAARGWRARLQQSFLLLAGGRVHDRFRAVLRPMPAAGPKRFAASDVNAIVKRLIGTDPRFAAIEVSPAGSRDGVVILPGGLRAVRVRWAEGR